MSVPFPCRAMPEDHLSSPSASLVDVHQVANAPATFMPLRYKGLVAFLALILYTVFLAGYVLNQKDRMLREFGQLERMFKTEDMVIQLKSATFHTILTLKDMVYSDSPARQFRAVEYDFGLIYSGRIALGEEFAAHLDLHVVTLAFERAQQDPSRPNLIELNARLHDLLAQVVALSERVRVQEESMSRQYKERSDAVTQATMVFGVVGLMLYGLAIGWFFSRLTRDILALKQRAMEVVKGYRGEPMAVGRNDEVGQLMTSVNQMAVELDEREKALGIERQKSFHQEKMAAVGALAAGVAHEIGNPIAAISGIAQAMKEVQQAPEVCPNPTESCRPDLILEQTARIARITREIAEFAKPRPAERELLDLNELIRASCSLMRYDKRFRKVDLRLELDSQLPAVSAIGDQITQVVMNLLINAADALEGLTAGSPTVTVRTACHGPEVYIAVVDNGAGMDEHTLAHAFDAFYTTKPLGQGTGLGLALCKSIVDGHGGRIEVVSKPGQGASVFIHLPLCEEEFE